MAAPTNQDPATATDLGTLPASVSQNVHDAGVTYTVWYKYTAVTNDVVLGMFAFGDLVGYSPTTQVFEGLTAANAGNPRYYQIGSEIAVVNKPIQFAVTVGQTYYFKFTRNSGTVTPAVLLIEMERAPNDTIPAGSILINDDDLASLPLAILSATDGTNLAFKWPFAGGDSGAILPNGISIFGNSVDFTVKVYNANLNLVATVNPFSGSDAIICCSNRDDTFYVCDQNTGLVTTISETGIQGGTTWDLGIGAPNVKVIAVSLDETILYYFVNTAGTAIKRWDLINDVALTDFVSGVAGYFMIFDMLVLSDGTILAGYQKNTATVDYFVRRYNAAGTILNTYSFGTTRLNRLAFALNDPTSFWAWFFITNSHSEFRNILISDGSTVTTFNTALYTIGSYQPTATATPERYGHAASCPFLILNNEIIPPPTIDMSGIYYINPNKTTGGGTGKHDSYYDDVEKKIPNPTIRTALIGE